MAVKLGFNCKLFRNTGTYGTPVWAAVPVMRDMKLTLEDEEWDASGRGAAGWDQAEPTTRKATIEGALIWDPVDTALTAIRDAYLNRTSLDMAALDGASSGASSQGLRAIWKVFSFSRNEELRAGCTIDVVFKPCYEVTNLPAWSTFA